MGFRELAALFFPAFVFGSFTDDFGLLDRQQDQAMDVLREGET